MRNRPKAWIGPYKSPWMGAYDPSVSETIRVPIAYKDLPEKDIGGYTQVSGRTLGEQHPEVSILIDPRKGDEKAFLQHELRHAKEGVMPVGTVVSPTLVDGMYEDFNENSYPGVSEKNIPSFSQNPWINKILQKVK